MTRRDYFVGQALAGLAAKLPVSEDRKFADRMLPQLAELAVILANEADLKLCVLEERESEVQWISEKKDTDEL